MVRLASSRKDIRLLYAIKSIHLKEVNEKLN
jgi:hypothetical protein